jgi:hypothetical protein
VKETLAKVGSGADVAGVIGGNVKIF